MKIKVTEERDCCQAKDLKPIDGSPKFGHNVQFKFCLHCGKRHEFHSFTDPAGGSDWEYLPMVETWAHKTVS